MQIRAVAAAALLLTASAAGAGVARAPVAPGAVGGDAPYVLALVLDAPAPEAGGAASVTLTVARPSAAVQDQPADPAVPLDTGEEAIGVNLTSTGGATIDAGSVTGCVEVVGGFCRLHGGLGTTSTVTFTADVPAGAGSATVRAAIVEHRPQDGAEFEPAQDLGASESAELAVGPGYAVTYSPEVVRAGDVVRVVVSGLPADGDWSLSWSQGVAPIGPFRSSGGVIDASFPILWFDPIGPRTLLVTDALDPSAAPVATTSRVPLLVVPRSPDRRG